MIYDYRKLRGKIVEKFSTQIVFSKAMRWSERTLSRKLNGKVAWKQQEIMLALSLLDLQECDIPTYFFTPKVQSI